MIIINVYKILQVYLEDFLKLYLKKFELYKISFFECLF